MTSAEIRSRIHQKIDSVKDPELLRHYFDMIIKDQYKISQHTFWDKLTDQQRIDIDQAYLEAEDETGNISNEEMMKKVSAWISK